MSLFLPAFNASDNERKELPVPVAETDDADPVARRSHILEELQSTERHFLARMQHLLQDYHAPLKARAKSSDPLLNMYQVNTLFPRSLEVIVKAHEAFYYALEGARQDEIPEILLQHVLATLLF
jgi:RhoGEF domain